MISKLRLKTAVERLPYAVGRTLVHVPFSMRLGRTYPDMQGLMQQFAGMDGKAKEQWILGSLQSIVRQAYTTIPFYKHHYDRVRYDPDRLTTLRHFAEVPIVTKADLRGFSVERRSTGLPGRMRVNTGGTSGEPLEFFLDRKAFAREWAHMHWIWRHAG